MVRSFEERHPVVAAALAPVQQRLLAAGSSRPVDLDFTRGCVEQAVRCYQDVLAAALASPRSHSMGVASRLAWWWWDRQAAFAAAAQWTCGHHVWAYLLLITPSHHPVTLARWV